jgi:hypothetical protein
MPSFESPRLTALAYIKLIIFSQSIERAYLDGNQRQQSSARHRNWERLCKVRQAMRECIMPVDLYYLREILAEAILKHCEEVVDFLKGELDLPFLISLKRFKSSVSTFSTFEEINFEEVLT